MVDIRVGVVSPVQNKQSNSDKRRRTPLNKPKPKDRRKNKKDRRQSVRDGIIVTLSDQPERRQQPDRRRSTA